jgi:hypothetical protein
VAKEKPMVIDVDENSRFRARCNKDPGNHGMVKKDDHEVRIKIPNNDFDVGAEITETDRPLN